MSLLKKFIVVPALALAACVGQGRFDGTVIIRNESGRDLQNVQVNVVVSDTKGRLQQDPIDDFDQINHVGFLAAGKELAVKYRSRSKYNIDTYVVWQNGNAARFDYGTVYDEGLDPTHVITVTPTHLLFDGKPPIDVQSDPERYYGKYNDKRNWPSYDR